MKLALRINQIVSAIFAFPRLPALLAGLAVICYLAQSIDFAHHQWSVLDEGNYIYKGWLFATGQYIQYQAYGPLTNHMPLSYLIFGYVQLLFGPGLRTVRYFMIFVGCLLMLGLWLTSRRLAGPWAAAASLWFLALTPFPISDYSVAISEGLVACVLTWILYFIVGENRSRWQLFAGALLVGVLFLIRENMILIVPIIFLYMLWQHGRQAGLILLGVVAFLFIGVHALYWPGIMEIWDRWIPNPIRPWFADLVYQDVARPLNAPLLKKLFVVLNSVQKNFLAVFAALAVWLSWPRGGFKSQSQFKTVVFLSVLFLGLYVAHASASLGKEYCTFCLVNYVTFFFPVGILLFFAFLPGIKERLPILPAWLVAGLVSLLALGLGYSNYPDIGQPLASIHVPRTIEFRLQPETVEIWRIIANKFTVERQFVYQLLPALAGLLVGLLIVGIGWVVTKSAKNTPLFSNSVYALILVTMVVGLVLSPSNLLGGAARSCDKDILLAYERVGAELAQRIPPGSQIYWRGDPSPAPLLYLTGIKIYPPQLNGGFSFRPPGDSERALRFGFWNRQLDRKWRTEADILLIRQIEFKIMNRTYSPKVFDELAPTSPPFPCAPDTQIRIFKRK